eukprot:10270916-Ditylum_brightwellii.AAC.1
MNLIDWDNLGDASECQCLKTTVQLVKFIHNWLNTGHQNQFFYEDDVVDCPVCHSSTETWSRIFQCQYRDFIDIQTLAITTFKSKLLKLDTAPIIKQVLCYKIAPWCNMLELEILQIAEDEIGEAISSEVKD